MKKAFIIFIVLCIVLVSGCSSEPKRGTPILSDAVNQTDYPDLIGEYLQDTGDRLYGVIPLCSGDVLVVEEEDGFYAEETIKGVTNVYTLNYVFYLLHIDPATNELRVETAGTGYNEIPYTAIFYPKNGDQNSSYCANFKLWPVENPTDVLVLAFVEVWAHEKYADSAIFGTEPKDTLGTKPLCVQDVSWRRGYPVWVFDIPLEKISEAYRLEYAGYVLTGNDILSFSWSPETGKVS